MYPPSQWYPHTNLDILRSLERQLECVDVISCSAAALGIDRKTFDEFCVADLRAAWGKRYRNPLIIPFYVKTMWMDCRLFAGPVGVPGHSGEHSRSLLIMSRHYNFRSWLELFKMEYLRCLREMRPGDRLNIICICDDGQWLSVACARILSHILRNKSRRLLHMQQQEWIYNEICPGYCDECVPTVCNTRKNKALDTCDKLWVSLFRLTNPLFLHCRPPDEWVSASILEPAQHDTIEFD